MNTVINKNLALALQDAGVQELIRKNARDRLKKANEEASAAAEILSAIGDESALAPAPTSSAPVRKKNKIAKKSLGTKTDAIRDVLKGEAAGMVAHDIRKALVRRGFKNDLSIHATLYSMTKSKNNRITMKNNPDGSVGKLYFYP